MWSQPRDEVGDSKKDQEVEGSRYQELVSCDKVLAIILRALGSHQLFLSRGETWTVFEL